MVLDGLIMLQIFKQNDGFEYWIEEGGTGTTIVIPCTPLLSIDTILFSV